MHQHITTAKLLLFFHLLVLMGHTAIANEKTDWQQRRIQAWQALIANHLSESDQTKVELVNAFINQLQYIDDLKKWGKPDYWASPQEFIKANGGDCEDFAIAKYFTLVSMGIPDSRLRVVSGVTLPAGQPHMLLYYYPLSATVPVVLDNRSNQLISAYRRSDFIPVYSFNRQAYWLVQPDESQQYLGSAQRLVRWKNVLQRWEKNITQKM